jgi:hypothetical protein
MEKIEYKGHTIRIEQDTDPCFNPREDFSNNGKMVCFHKRYDLGDSHDIKHEDYNSWEEMKESLDAAIILPLYLIDHGGISMSVGSFGCQWDSGQVGFIYMTKETLKDFDGDLEWAENCLRGEVETYDQYITGAIYGYSVDGPVCDDSCWGFFGYDNEASGLLNSAKENIDYMVAQEAVESERYAKQEAVEHEWYVNQC